MLTSQVQYKIYVNVWPGSKTTNDFKQNMAIQIEKNAAAALKIKKDSVKRILHYDSSQR